MQALLSKLETIMPRDKLMHLTVGLIVGTFALLLLALEFAACAALQHLTHGGTPALAFYRQHLAFFAVLNAGACVHVAKEGMDRLDNLMMYHQGKTAIHGVEWQDAAAGQLGTTLLALAGLWAGVL